jgi:hypothetical protein
LGVSMLAVEGQLVEIEAIAEKSVTAKFAEFPFHALR